VKPSETFGYYYFVFIFFFLQLENMRHVYTVDRITHDDILCDTFFTAI